MSGWTKVRVGLAVLTSTASVVIAAATAGPAGAATTHDVSIVGLSFSPSTLIVEPGDTVVWTNDSGLAHTVTADNGSFDSGSLSPGQTFTHTFASAGTVPYHCSFHGAAGGIGMSGTIVVQAAPPPSTTPRVTTPTTVSAVPGVKPTPGSTTAPPSAPAPGAGNAPVAGATATATGTGPAPQLAHTGGNSAGLALLAAVLLLVGGPAAVTARRRSHRRPPT
jgi:LPXTG-motif cell wall-anchored protein